MIYDLGLAPPFYINIANRQEIPILCYNFAGISKLTRGRRRIQGNMKRAESLIPIDFMPQTSLASTKTINTCYRILLFID